MINFNELRITPDGKNLIIDVSVLTGEYYDNVYIDSIMIDTQDTYISSGPSAKAVYTYNVSADKNLKNIRLVLEGSDMNDIGILRDNIFFVYVSTKGAPSPDIPCGWDNTTTMQSIVDLYSFYQKSMVYIRELSDTCNIPKGFIDFILRVKALEISIKTGNYVQAIKYWNKYFKGNALGNPTIKCNCYG